MALQEHCDVLRDDARVRECIKFWDYVIRDEAGNQTSVLCKFCGTAIQGYRAVGQPKMTRMPDQHNTVLVIQEVAMLWFNNYREMLLRFSDGSAHATPLCDKCALRTFTPEEMEWIHICDMEDLHACCVDDRQREAHEKLAMRNPVSHEEHAFMGEGKTKPETVVI